jgi:hypothetical protein
VTEPPEPELNGFMQLRHGMLSADNPDMTNTIDAATEIMRSTKNRAIREAAQCVRLAAKHREAAQIECARDYIDMARAILASNGL